jgi:dTDP-4-dehydrorhamnose reductase
MRVAVIGANGQLGSDLVSAFADHHDSVSPLTHDDVEVRTLESLRTCLHSANPEIIVNTAAIHHVDRCESEPQSAYVVNALGVRNLAIVAREIDATLVHFSTDYVFPGTKSTPYIEEDLPRPLNVYGNSKLAGEYYAQTLSPKHFVVRTSALYGKHHCRGKGGNNFVQLMLDLARTRGSVRVVNNEFVTPTSTSDLARQVVALSQCTDYGLYHATAEGSCSWYEFAREIFSQAGVEVKLEVARPGEFPAKAPRPAYSVLENRRLKELGIAVFTSWQEGLQQYLTETKKALVDEVTV